MLTKNKKDVMFLKTLKITYCFKYCDNHFLYISPVYYIIMTLEFLIFIFKKYDASCISFDARDSSHYNLLNNFTFDIHTIFIILIIYLTEIIKI